MRRRWRWESASGIELRALLLAVAAAVTIAASTGPALAEDGDDDEYAFSPGDRLVLDFEAGGTAIVTGWDESKASVSTIHVRRRRSDRDDGDDEEKNRVYVSSEDGVLRVGTESTGRYDHFESLTFEIRVPRKVRIDFQSEGGGLELHDLEGDFGGRTMGGAFVLTDVVGSADLHSGGGTIEVTDCRLDGEITTGGGKVLLKNVVGNLEATSGGGDIRYVNVRDEQGRIRSPDGSAPSYSTEETVLIASAGGEIRVRSAPAGARVQTGGGDVTVLRAERFVKARTGGGDIRVEVRNGWVKAQTGAGDVEVEVAEGLGDDDEGVEIVSGLGDIVVVIPKDASVEIDAEIGYTRQSRRSFRIKSDFDLDLSETDEWSHRHGSPKKFIRGTAKINGGRHLVKVRTTNGNVRIEQGD